MAAQYADRVAESTTTTGTGSITLAGALTGFRAFSTVMSTSDTCFYALQAVDGSGNPTGAWETGLGTYTGTNTLARTTVYASSAGGSAITLAGTTYVFLAPLAATSPQFGPDNGMSMPSAGTTALTTPTGSNLKLVNRTVAGRQMLAEQAPDGGEYLIMPHLGRRQTGLWIPAGNATTVPGVFGITAPTAIGTATARTIMTSNLANRMRRIGYPSSSVAGNFGGIRINAAQFSCGSGTPADGSGVFAMMRWVESDAAPVSGRREFIGLANGLGAPSNVEPNTLTNVVGICQLSTDATQYYWYAAGSSAQTAVAIGTGIGAPAGNSTTAWELTIWAPSAIANTFKLQLTNLSTGVTSTTSFTGAATVVPQSTTLLNVLMWACNNATAAAVGIDVCTLFLETEF
jgi:hypothetical protein